MGLLEKALEFKKEINRKGQDTLIDKIKGPAETEFISQGGAGIAIEETPVANESASAEVEAPPDFSDTDNASFEDVMITDLSEDEDAQAEEEALPDFSGTDDASFEDVMITDLSEDEEAPAEEEALPDFSDTDDASFEDVMITDLSEDEDAPAEEATEPDFSEEEEEADEDELEDISETIYEIGTGNRDEFELSSDKDEIAGLMEEEGTNIDDDLFSLPDDNDTRSPSPLKQKKGDEGSFGPVSADAGQDTAAGPQEDNNDNPLGKEDEPVLPAPAPRQTDDNQTAGREKGAAEIKPEKTDIKEKTREKEKAIGKFLEDEEEDEIDEVVYSFDDFQDFPVLYEILKDISRADTKEELYDVILFSINGQLGCSSSSVIIASMDDPNKWIVANSLGIDVTDELFFNSDEGILRRLKRNIIDIDDYTGDPECLEQYDKFISIDTKLIAPIVFKKKILGALILGEKITEEPYTKEEFGLILSVCNASATLFNKVAMIERLNNENLGLKSDLDYSLHLSDLQDIILRNASMRTLEKNILKEFEYLWIEHFSVFIKNERDDSFVPFVVDSEDYLALKSSGFRIENRNLFIDYVRGLEKGEKIEMFDKLDAVRAAFSKDMLKKIELLWIYPFKVGNQLIGFITVFRIRDRILEQEIDNHLRKYVKVLFSSILCIKEVDPEENRYIDNIEMIFKRINFELYNAIQMNIPLTLILFSIKNFKRYANLYGYSESVSLINNCVDILSSKLADNDFSARIDRNKILIVLPGKDKKFAIPLANSIRNQVMQGFKKKEIQLLITFLMAEYPEDGDTAQGLFDCID